MSRAGKKVLLKAVVQAIPIYTTSRFLLPDNILRDIQSMASNFWWGDQSKAHNTHWISWNKLCIPKNQGGLGFRNLKAFNYAMLGKQAWRILNMPTSLLHHVLKAKYFPKTDFLQARLGHRPSFTRRGILEGHKSLNIGCRLRVGSSCSIRIWHDRWLP